MPDVIITGTSIEHLKTATYMAVGTGLADNQDDAQFLDSEVTRAPILDILHGVEFLEFRALIPEDDLPKLDAIAPEDAVREIGLFWGGSEQVNTGLLLYRSIGFAKKLLLGNDLYLVIRIYPEVSDTITAATRPAQPDAPTLTSPSPTALRVEWYPPHDGGVDITKYDVRYRRVGVTSWTTRSGHVGLQYTIIGLTAETEYQVQIRAVNAIQSSLWSSSAQRMTIAEFEFDTGALFLADRISSTSFAVWRLNDIDNPSLATLLYTLNYGEVTALAFDGIGLLFVNKRNGSGSLHRITNFTTTSPTVTQIGSNSLINISLIRGLVYADGRLVMVGTRQIRVIEDLDNPVLTSQSGLPGSDNIQGLAYGNNKYLALSNSSHNIYSFDITNPSGATLEGTITESINPNAIAWNGRLLVLSTNEELHTVADIANPTAILQGELPSTFVNPTGAVWAEF